ncbi:heterokaryon incompatibility protein-domain-containing protein [Ampelomyces quisqualis]|uniref:Heterokaryon incompatibility protein-domain-containing protein n=1 Tax=Ampelomyces quisqualis TaxID=50730 RepID=A0A6A5QKM4_AMPQU|nr:heterokaryon incompatibility protein-domain-containing protein [Ampelomyces quisqualis]
MSFSYEHSLEAWKPMVDHKDARIRVLELYPLPWYLRWVPTSWESYIPLRASLVWTPLAEIRVSRRRGPNEVSNDVVPIGDTEIPATNETTQFASSSASQENSVNQAKLDSTLSKVYPSYKALSYTWGDGKAKGDIGINGTNLTITLSLTTALYHLRHRSEPMKIWIDQISINQDDLQEKTEQVQLMDRIYRNTEETLVWLGPAQSGSEALMNVFNKMGAFAERFELYSYYTKEKHPELRAIEDKVNPEDVKTVEYHDFCDSVMGDFTYALFESLIAFYSLPWFRRAWVRTVKYTSQSMHQLMTCRLFKNSVCRQKLHSYTERKG